MTHDNRKKIFKSLLKLSDTFELDNWSLELNEGHKFKIREKITSSPNQPPPPYVREKTYPIETDGSYKNVETITVVKTNTETNGISQMTGQDKADLDQKVMLAFLSKNNEGIFYLNQEDLYQ